MARLTFRRALPADHAALERLFASTPMGHHIRVILERSPDFFATTRAQCDSPEVFGYFDEAGEAAAIFSAGSRQVWLEGIRPMRYLSDLRIHPAYQGAGLLARGFQRLRREVMQPGEWAQTLVLGDNKNALSLLQSRRAGLPEYRDAGRYHSWLLPPQKKSIHSNIRVRSARPDDLEAMAHLYAAFASRRCFAPEIDIANGLPEAEFLVAERGGGIIGMMGLWDQSAFQRLRIAGYSKPMRWLRPLWNRLATLPLPLPGELVPMKKVTTVACEDDDPEPLVALLSHALEVARVPLLAGCSAQDPLRRAYHLFEAHRTTGRHFLVGWEGEPPAWREPFVLDAARI